MCFIEPERKKTPFRMVAKTATRPPALHHQLSADTSIESTLLSSILRHQLGTEPHASNSDPTTTLTLLNRKTYKNQGRTSRQTTHSTSEGLKAASGMWHVNNATLNAGKTNEALL